MTAALLVISRATTSIFTIIIAATLSRLLSYSEYANYQQAILVFSMSFPLLASGLPNALLHFVPLCYSKRRSLIVDNVYALSLLGFLFFVLCWAASPLLAIAFSNELLHATLLPLSFYGMAMFLGASIPPALISIRESVTLAWFQPISRLFMLLCICSVALFTRTAQGAAIGAAVAASIASLSGLWILSRKLPSESRAINCLPFHKRIRGQIHYAFPLAIAGVLDALMVASDKVIVATLTNPTQYAVYVNGAFEIPLITIITAQAAAVLQGDISKYAHNGLKDPKPSFRRATSLSAFFVFPCTALLYLISEDLLVLLFTEKYSDSVAIFRIYLFLLPFRIVLFGPVFAAYGKGRLMIIRAAVGLGINILLSVPAILFFGPAGGAWATVLTIVLFVIPFCAVNVVKLFKCPVTDLVDLASLAQVAIAVILSSILCGVIQMRLPTVSSLTMVTILSIAFSCGYLGFSTCFRGQRTLLLHLINNLRMHKPAAL